jgi:hypothetical protein
MSYVPIVPNAPSPQEASPRARELGVQMAQLLQDYREQNPSLTSTEVQQAMQIAREATGLGKRPAAGVLAAVGLGLVGVLVAGFMILRRGGFEGGVPIAAWPMVMIGILVVALAGLALVIRNQ